MLQIQIQVALIKVQHVVLLLKSFVDNKGPDETFVEIKFDISKESYRSGVNPSSQKINREDTGTFFVFHVISLVNSRLVCE